MTGVRDGARPLEGLRVVEMGSLLAGPFCGQLLGDFGAEVTVPTATWRCWSSSRRDARPGPSEGGRREIPEIPWREIIAMRNRLIHAYFDVDLDVVWTTVRDDLFRLPTCCGACCDTETSYFFG